MLTHWASTHSQTFLFSQEGSSFAHCLIVQHSLTHFHSCPPPTSPVPVATRALLNNNRPLFLPFPCPCCSSDCNFYYENCRANFLSSNDSTTVAARNHGQSGYIKGDCISKVTLAKPIQVRFLFPSIDFLSVDAIQHSMLIVDVPNVCCPVTFLCYFSPFTTLFVSTTFSYCF